MSEIVWGADIEWSSNDRPAYVQGCDWVMVLCGPESGIRSRVRAVKWIEVTLFALDKDHVHYYGRETNDPDLPTIDPEEFRVPHPPCPIEDPEYYHYLPLQDVLNDALEQASKGKGYQRHSNGKPFDEQPMAVICGLVGDGFALGQAIKKITESQGLSPDRARHELLGAIVYIAGAVISLKGEE